MTLGERGDHDVVDAQVVETPSRGDDVHDGVNRANLVEVHLLHGNPVRLGLCRRDDVKDAVRKLAGAVRQVGGVDDGLDVGRAAMLVVMMVMPMPMVMVVLVLMLVLVMVVLMLVLVLVMVVLVLMLVLVLVLVLMLMIVFVVMVTMFVIVAVQIAVEPLHVVVMTVMGLVQHHVKVADVDARNLATRYGNLKALDTKSLKRLNETLGVSTGVNERGDDHVAADAARAIQIERPSHAVLLCCQPAGMLWH